jgi:hypothetical protein
MDDKMLKAGGEAKRKELVKQMEELSLDNRAKMNDEEEYKMKHGDYMQAEKLLE